MYIRKVTVTNFNTIPQMVLETDRIGTMQTRLARQLANYYPIRLLPAPVQIPNLHMAMQWHPFMEKDPAHQWLRSLMRDAAQNESRSPQA